MIDSDEDGDPDDLEDGKNIVSALAAAGAETNDVHRTLGFQLIPTVGSVLVLKFAEVLQLTEGYFAPGSLGSFSLQVSVNVANTQVKPWNAGEWELVILPMTPGGHFFRRRYSVYICRCSYESLCIKC